MTRKLKAVLTIAGSDPSGGAGIQADLKTMAALGVYGMSAITALTAQNTQGVYDILPVPLEFFKKQLDLVLKDIRPAAVKIGMLGREDLILATKEILGAYKIENIVLDPVMLSSSGKKLLDPYALKALEELFKTSKLITPNLLEAQALLNREIKTMEEIKVAAEDLGDKYETSVLVKGGHRAGSPDDVLYSRGQIKIFLGQRIDNPNNHGTGCTLSSALESYLDLGYDLDEAVEKSKAYMTGALKADLDLGLGPGPLNHMWKYYQGEENENLDWERQFELAIDPERARQIRADREPEDDDTCSMCGKFCAIRSMNKALAGEEIDIL